MEDIVFVKGGIVPHLFFCRRSLFFGKGDGG